MKIEIPKYIAEMLEALEAGGFDAYVVGGCVRDALLSREPQDWDIATNALPHEAAACFPHHRVIETGVKHGTITVVPEAGQAEITTFRIDGGYGDFRHPDNVSFTRELEPDLARRDFTINAMAYNPKRGIVDCFGGVDDLQKRRIACVGDASQRFSEDALRILRAVRFASTLGFRIEESTLEAMNEQAFLLDKISRERIASELCKALTGDAIAEVLLAHAQIFTRIIPELAESLGFAQHSKYHHLDVWRHTAEAVGATPRDLILRLTMLFHDCGKPKCFTFGDDGEGHFYRHAKISAELADKALSRLHFDNATRTETVYLIMHHCDLIKPESGHMKRMLNKMGEERLRRLIAVMRADGEAKAPEYRQECGRDIGAAEAVLDEIILQNQAFSLKDIAVRGDDLLEIGFERGKIIGDTLNKLLELVMDGKIENTREALLSRAKSLLG